MNGRGRSVGTGNHGRTRSLSRAAVGSLERLESRTLLAVTPLDIGHFKGRPGQFGTVNGTTLFTTTDFPNGQLLWATDGTAQGTRLVTDLETSNSTAAQWFIGGRDNALTVGNTFYFTGVDNAHGRELWRSDGTPEGTHLVRDIATGPGDSDPEGFVALGNQLIFSANKQLWRTDGTAEGTVLLKDADPLGFAAPERMAVLGDHVFFTVYPRTEPYNGETNTGQLWRTDGTPEGTVMIRDISPQPFDPVGSAPARMQMINVGGTLFFTANDGINGYELWRSDGTKKGTLLVRDLMTGGATPFHDGSYPSNLTNVNGTLFFSAAGFLWKTDGTGRGTIKLKTVAQPRGFTNVNGNLFFASDETLWTSDGTRAGTRQVAPAMIAEHFGPKGTSSLNGRLYFGADGGKGFELFETDGTRAHTAMVFDAEPGSGSSHAQVLGRTGEKVVFIARNDATALWQVYALDVPRPHAPRNLRLPGEHDTGISASDRTTNTMRPTITGTAPADALVRLFANGVEVGSTFARGGTFAILSGVELSDGTHTFTATARDELGRTSAASAPMNVKIDTTPATVRFKPLSPQTLQLKFSEYVGGSISADDVTIQDLGSGHTYTGSALSVEYTNRTNTASITFPDMPMGLAAGNYRLTVRGANVSDVAGNAMEHDASFEFAPPAGPIVGAANGRLAITGTDGADSIVIRHKKGAPHLLEVGVNNAFTTHAASGISLIRVFALAGDDRIAFDPVNGAIKIRSTIYAGDGNDTVIGGATRDRVYAGAGDDLVRGSGGHDILYGEDGNDTLIGERGNDYLVGGIGRDVVQGNFGSDRLIVEAGIDDVLLDPFDQIITQTT